MLLLSLIAFSATMAASPQLGTNDDSTDCAGDWKKLGTPTGAIGVSCIFTNSIFAGGTAKATSYPKITPSEAAAACEAIDSRSTLIALFSEAKVTALNNLLGTLTTNVDSKMHTVSGVPRPNTLPGSYSGVLMKDGEIDPWFTPTTPSAYGPIEIAADQYAAFDADTAGAPTSSQTAQQIVSVANADSIYYICEICLPDSLDKCGSRAQRTTIIGEREFPMEWGTCDAPSNWKRVSHLICEDCRCWGASKKTRQFKSEGDRDDVPYLSRKDCEVAALAAGYDHYSWMPMGFRTGCVFGDKYSNSLACGEELRQTSLQRSWSIYQVKKQCIKQCKTTIDEVPCTAGTGATISVGADFPGSDPRLGTRNIKGELVKVGGCKCAGTTDIQYHPQKKRFLTKEACGEAAQSNGYTYFNWRESKKWCYFGRSRGAGFPERDALEGAALDTYPNNKCLGSNQRLTIDDWKIYTVACEPPTEGWYLAGVAKNCAVTCEYHGLQCTQAGLEVNDPQVDDTQGLMTVLADILEPEQLAVFEGRLCEQHDVAAPPLITLTGEHAGYCATTKTLNSKPYSCGETPTAGTQKQRLCYCVAADR